MRLNSHATLGLLAATVTNALPRPQDDSPPAISPSGNDADTLAQLAVYAQDVTNSSLPEEKKRALPGSGPGSCTLKTLSIRREWYVIQVPHFKGLYSLLVEKGITLPVRKESVYRCCLVPPEQAIQDTIVFDSRS